MEFSELLDQCKYKKLRTTLEKIHAESIKNGVEFNIYTDMVDMLFDVETEEDFGENIMSYFEISMVNKSADLDGWQDNLLNEDYAKLLRGWNWKNVTLKNKEHIVIVSEDEVHGGIGVMIFNIENLHSGAIEMRHWFPNHFYQTVKETV